VRGFYLEICCNCSPLHFFHFIAYSYALTLFIAK
jgi:hypothetical protein